MQPSQTQLAGGMHIELLCISRFKYTVVTAPPYRFECFLWGCCHNDKIVLHTFLVAAKGEFWGHDAGAGGEDTFAAELSR